MKKLHNEQGNITLFTVGSMFLVMLMFIFVMNLGKVFAVKEEAHTSAQHASLAATAVLYEEIWDAVDDYENTIIGMLESYPKTIREKVDEKRIELSNSHPDWSYNESYVEAIDQVLAKEMRSGFESGLLKSAIKHELHFDMKYKMKQQASYTINLNGGTLNGAEIKFFEDNRIYVRAANTMDSIDYGTFFNSFTDDVYQVGAGPEINFLDELDGWSNTTESLN